jgi:cytochrome b561
MGANKRAVAAVELLLIAPAALFMISLFLREVQPLAQTGRVVEWFTHHLVLGLYVFLFSMPLAAFIGGCTVLLRSWGNDPQFRSNTSTLLRAAKDQWATLLVAAATVSAAGILFVVALHMLTE